MIYSKIWTFAALLALVAVVSCTLSDQNKTGEPLKWTLPIVPHPQEIHLKEQGFVINPQTRILVSNSALINRIEIELLNSALGFKGVQPLKFGSNSCEFHNAIILAELESESPWLDSLALTSGLKFTRDYPGPEGYVLDVTPDYVLIAGADSSGTFYGVQSFIQLIFGEETNDELRIRAVTIIDYPDMPLRSAFYGFYLNALENDSLIERAYVDFKKISRYKFNMIDLSTHHYSHVEMAVPGHSEEKLWQRFAGLHEQARRYNLRPRVGGWAKWVNTKSPWGSDLTTLEGIRTSQMIEIGGMEPSTLRIASGQAAPNVMYEFATGKTWEREPLVVTDESGSVVYQEGEDYLLNFGRVQSENYQKYYKTPQTNLEVLFSQVNHGVGEPKGYPLRWAETFNSPTTIQWLPEGRIDDGQTLKVNFTYIGPDPWSILKVRYCRSDERLHTDGPENYIWRWCTDPVRFWGADDFSLDVDETRVFAWDKRCLESGKSRSQIWADDIRYYYKTIRSANPGARISMWSDMVDPAHNAALYGTEEVASIVAGQAMQDIIMIPWKSSIAHESVRFFADKGLPIMPSCQQVTAEGWSVAPKWANLLRQFYTGKKLPFGLMHCTWEYAFDSEIGWEQLATVADHAWSVAPYIIHTPVKTAYAGTAIEIIAKIEGDKYVFDGKSVHRGPLPVKNAFLYYKKISEAVSSFTKVVMEETGTEFTAQIPALTVTTDTIAYYIEVSDKFNTSYCPKLWENKPYKITITGLTPQIEAIKPKFGNSTLEHTETH